MFTFTNTPTLIKNTCTNYNSLLSAIKNANTVKSFELTNLYTGIIYIPDYIIAKLVKNNKVEMVEFLLFRGYPILTINYSIVNDLVLNNNVEMLTLLLHHDYPITFACSYQIFIKLLNENNVYMVKILAKYGLLNNKYIANKYFQNLVLANNISMVILFLDYDISVNMCSNETFELIVNLGKIEMITLLVKHGFFENNSLRNYGSIVAKILKIIPELSIFLIEREKKIAYNCLINGKIIDPYRIFRTINNIIQMGNIDAFNYAFEKFGITVLNNLSQDAVSKAIMYLHHVIVQKLVENGIILTKYFSQSAFDNLCQESGSRTDVMIELLLNTELYYPNKLSLLSFRKMIGDDNIIRFRLMCKYGLNIFIFPNTIFEYAINNGFGSRIIMELLSCNYCPNKSKHFHEELLKTNNNISSMLVFAPLARESYEFSFIDGRNIKHVLVAQKTNYACIRVLMSFIGGPVLTKNNHGCQDFSEILFNIFVFKRNLENMSKGTICALLEEALFPEINGIDGVNEGIDGVNEGIDGVNDGVHGVIDSDADFDSDNEDM